MKIIEKIQEKENPIFERKEVKVLVNNDSTPSHKDTEEFISKEFSIKPETFKIKEISGRFGSKDFKISVNIYPSKEKLQDVEVKTKQEIEAEKKAIEDAKKAEEEKKKADEEKRKAEEETAKKEEALKQEKTQEIKDETPKEEEKKEDNSEENKQEEIKKE
jgi:ribosomal protein S24E